MSRIGKKPVPVPSGVTANVEGQTVKVKGPKGALQLVLHDDVAAKMDKGAIKVDPRDETKRARSQWGTSRTLVANLMTGVTKGFEHKLEITGVGYRAAVQGKNLQLRSATATTWSIRSRRASRSRRRSRPRSRSPARQAEGRPGGRRNPRFPPAGALKGKGVKYAGEYIFRKEGKKK